MTPIEITLALLWCLLLFRSRYALIPAFILCVEIIALSHGNGYVRCLLTASLYFSASAANIRISLDFRHALWLSGLLYLLAAVDEFIYQWLAVSTFYYDAMPYLVIIACAYMAAALFNKGGLDSVGVHQQHERSFVSRFFRLQ